MFYVQIALLGIIFGCLYALSATGIVLTYTATGVFNIAHFAIALLAGYLGWQLNGVWGVPLVVDGADRAARVRPGARARARAGRVPAAAGRDGPASSEKLVAALGVTVRAPRAHQHRLGPGRAGHDRRAGAAAVRP